MTKHLIDAAPELLDALKAMAMQNADVVEVYRDVIGTDDEPGWIFDMREGLRVANAAIAKAEGRTE